MNYYNNNNIKDLIGQNIKKVGGSLLFNATSQIVNSMRKDEFSVLNRMEHYVDVDTKKELLEKKIEKNYKESAKADDKIDQAFATFNDPKSSFYSLIKYAELKESLKNKRINYQKNGLSNFSLPTLVLMQLRKNIKENIKDTINDTKETITTTIDNTINNTKDKINQSIQDIKDKSVYKTILELFEQKIKVSKDLKDLEKEHPEIYNQVIADITGIEETKEEPKKTTNDDFIEELPPKRK